MIVILEGPDNVGKSSITKEVHKLLVENNYLVHQLHYSSIPGLSLEKNKIYSKKLYIDMFETLMTRTYQSNYNVAFILDRSHIGEMIYSPMYRKYSGDYVLDIECYYTKFLEFWNSIYLITIIDSPENLIARDDGLSFSIDKVKKQIEIDGFIRANKLSNIKNKFIVECIDKNLDQVKQETINRLKGYINE